MKTWSWPFATIYTPEGLAGCGKMWDLWMAPPPVRLQSVVVCTQPIIWMRNPGSFCCRAVVCFSTVLQELTLAIEMFETARFWDPWVSFPECSALILEEF